MEAVEHAGGERVARAGCALAVAGRQLERGLLEAEAFGGRADGAVLGMDGGGLLDAEGEELLGGAKEPTGVLGVDDLADDEPGLDLVDDEVVGQGQGAEGDLAELRVRGADHVDRGFQAG